MRKLVSIVLVLSICLLCLSGCGAKDNKQTRRVVELNNSNCWKYLTITEGTTVAAPQTETALSGSIRGVLDYAYYEDVVVTYELAVRMDGAEWDNTKRYEVKVKLNAAGDAEFEIEYTGVAVPSIGNADIENPMELYGFYRNLFFKSVSGKVIYTI